MYFYFRFYNLSSFNNNVNDRYSDPCIYVMRFAHRMDFGDNVNEVSQTALRLVQRMKKDCIHTGRRPSGLCGAGNFISIQFFSFRNQFESIPCLHSAADSGADARIQSLCDGRHQKGESSREYGAQKTARVWRNSHQFPHAERVHDGRPGGGTGSAVFPLLSQERSREAQQDRRSTGFVDLFISCVENEVIRNDIDWQLFFYCYHFTTGAGSSCKWASASTNTISESNSPVYE